MFKSSFNSPPSSDAIAFGITILFNASLNTVAVGFESLLGVSIPQAYFEKEVRKF